MSDETRRYVEAIAPLYSRAFADHGDDTRSLFVPKGRQTLRYESMLAGLEFDSVLDVGCGIGLLQAHLQSAGRTDVRYVGVDIVPEMVDLCRRKFPQAEVHCAATPDAVDGTFDLVVIAGTFNIVPEQFTGEQYTAFVLDAIAAWYAKARRYLVFDFMTDLVDYRQRGAFHLSHAEAIAFVAQRLSRRFEVIQSYMPYEAAVRVFVDDRIDRERNVFAAVGERR